MALSDEITALQSAIRRGVKSVQYDGHSVTYQSLDDMQRVLRQMQREAGATIHAGPSYPAFSKGLE